MREVAGFVRQQRAVLHQTDPGGEIARGVNSYGVPGGWIATRRAPLTHSQRAAGLLPTIVRGDAPALVMALAVQGEIAQQASS
jgi:hypothetical protein